MIVIFGNDESSMNYSDNTYRFRQDSTFLYYFGIHRPKLVALLDIDNEDEVIFGDDYSVEDVVWMGSQTSLPEMAYACGVVKVRALRKLSSVFDQVRKRGQALHFLPPYRSKNKIKLYEYLGVEPRDSVINYSVELVRAVISQREIKTDEEIIQLNEAVDVSVDMHIAAITFARPGMTEAQVTAEIHKTALANGGDISFPIIATINGQTLHNHFHGNIIEEGDLFLIDAGYENQMCYAGDLSSTFPVGRKFTSQQKEIYQITLDAHQAAINALCLNVPFKKAHLDACHAIFDGLRSMGMTRGNSDDAVEAGAHALFFPCGAGHMMGLDVHDMEDLGEIWVGYNGEPKSAQFGLKSLRLAKPLQAGHVFTIEPGIYFIPELIDMWRSKNKYTEFINWDEVNRFRHFGGIRNEEDFVMTKNGAQLLGKAKPKTIEDIEDLRSEVF